MRLVLLVVFATLSVFGTAQNTLLNRPGTVDDLVILEGAAALLNGARAENVRPSADGASIELVDGALAGSLTIAGIQTRFPFNEAIPSWNGHTPPDTGFRVWMSPILANRAPSSWFDAGTWGHITDELTTRIIPLNSGVYNIDTLLLHTVADGVAVRFDLVRSSSDRPSPRIFLFALSYSNSTGNQALARKFGPDRRAPITPSRLDIPYHSQVVKKSAWIGRICSPCSVNMALGRFGIKQDTQALATELYDPVSDAFGVWHRAIQGASQQGVRGYITRFRTWGQVSEALARGYVICPSIRFKANEVDDPMRRHGRRMSGTEGHLVLLTGINTDGTVTVHDTASKDHGVNSVWRQEELAKAWFDKGGVAYVFTGPRGAAAVPMNP